MKLKNFFKDLACGAAIGVAMIIPGVSGGTIAVITGVYDKIINAISCFFKDFKNSVLFLLPIILGAVAAFAAMYFPLRYALNYAPLPTVLLFAGLMAGTLPKLFKDCAARGFKKTDIVAVILPLAVIIGISFIPKLGTADLSLSMPVWGYFALIGIGAVASCALVIPGISGSMLLLILGYYQPVLDTVSLLFTDFGHSVLVLGLFVIGVIAGFFTIAKLMKYLFGRFPRGTYWAITGFVIGSIPAIFISFPSNFTDAPCTAAQIAVGAILCVLGIIATYALTSYIEGKQKAVEENSEIEENAVEKNTEPTEK